MEMPAAQSLRQSSERFPFSTIESLFISVESGEVLIIGRPLIYITFVASLTNSSDSELIL